MRVTFASPAFGVCVVLFFTILASMPVRDRSFVLPPSPAPRELGQILGLVPGVAEPEAREHLRRVGRRTAVFARRAGDPSRELWEVHDPTWACVMVAFEGGRVRWLRGYPRDRSIPIRIGG